MQRKKRRSHSRSRTRRRIYDRHVSSLKRRQQSENEAKKNVTVLTVDDNNEEKDPLGCFGKYLTVWVALCIVIGTLIGYFIPEIPENLEKTTYAQVNFPTAVLIWLIIFPMMMQIKLSAIWLVLQPFFMYGLALLFFNVIFASLLSELEQQQYIAGAVILGGSPCTAMVFVWSALSRGDPAYTLVQVLVNDIILLVLYAPTVKLLLTLSNITMPWTTIILSVVLFVVVPFAVGLGVRQTILHWKSEETLHTVNSKLKPVSSVALLAILVLIFTFQAETLVANWSHIFIISVPLILQNVLVFLFAYVMGYLIGLPHNVAAPASFVASSNFFELGVSVSITAYGLESGAALANVVGVLVEVPVMLLLVYIANKTRKRFEEVEIEQRPLRKLWRKFFPRKIALEGGAPAAASQNVEVQPSTDVFIDPNVPDDVRNIVPDVPPVVRKSKRIRRVRPI